MSAALIRCLLAVWALDAQMTAVASKDVARLLGVKRPTIHRSLTLLQEKGLVEKAPYGDVHLTAEGKAQAQCLETRRDDLTLLLSQRFGLSPDESVKAAFALMDGLSEESLRRLQDNV